MNKPILFLLAFLSSITTAATCHAQASFFDPTFGMGGTTIIPFTGTDGGFFDALAVQPDGKILAAGAMSGNVLMVRFKENGTIDSSFAENGFYSTGIWGRYLYDIVLQPDGKILAAGTSEDNKFLTIRLNHDGTPDLTFGSSGVVITDLTPGTDNGYALALQVDGRIVIAGQISPANMGLARLLGNGNIDSSFGTDGIVIGPYGRASDIEITPDGKIIAGGHATASHDYAFIAARYLPDGTLDTSFNHTGIAYTIAGTPGSNFGKALKAQPDGKVLLAGSGEFGVEGGNFVVVRYDSNGLLDGSFGSGGIAGVDFYGRDDAALDMVLAPDGKIVLSGSSINPDNKAELAITRLNNDGTMDNSFGTTGKILNPLRSWGDNGMAVALQPDGKIIVGGNSYRDIFPNNYYDAFISRFTSDPSKLPLIGRNDGVGALYPNPSNGHLYIDEKAAQISSISATDIAGKRISVQYIAGSGTIDIRHIPAGLYFFRMEYLDGRIAMQKILVMNKS
jgi:uncharacterized delta-60 repeat protein